MKKCLSILLIGSSLTMVVQGKEENTPEDSISRDSILGCAANFPCLDNASFRAYIADNKGEGSHFRGYNGLAALIPHCLGQNIFVPHYAGMNYETIELEGNLPYNNKFEPRDAPIEILFTDQKTVVLKQAKTVHSEVSAMITFRIEEPYYLHQRIELTFHKRFADTSEKQRFTSLFASYVFMPEDPNLYIRPHSGTGDPLKGWYAIYKSDNNASNYLLKKIPEKADLMPEDIYASLETAEAVADTFLLKGNSAGDIPLYYYFGFLAADLVYIQMFKQPEKFRFAYSPSWGGHVNNWVEGKEYDSPAWDYRLFHDDIKIGETYSWDCCIIVKPYNGMKDVIGEYIRYLSK